MQILIVGSGGREHALAFKAAQSPLVSHVWVAPGNAGTHHEPKTQNIDIAATDIDALVKFAVDKSIDLTVVGPETPLSLGIVDAFYQKKCKIFGPTREGAQLETSKAFSKNFMSRYGIPTPHYRTFKDKSAAISYLNRQTFPIVIKVSGLASGKGVFIVNDPDEAKKTVTLLFDDLTFIHATQEIIIEEFLTGQELTFLCLTDGKRVIPFSYSQDHKRRDEGDKGPNTGGMGAYSPVPFVTPELEKRILNEIIYPTLKGIQSEHLPYLGFLYMGLMITPQYEIKVLEYNARLGDPEAQCVLMRLQTDLIALLIAFMETDEKMCVEWDPRASLGVVLTSRSYPDMFETGKIIKGLDRIKIPEVKLFHSGTSYRGNDIVTASGRVLTAVALEHNITSAHKKVYEAIQNISWEGCYYRTDIGHRAFQDPTQCVVEMI